MAMCYRCMKNTGVDGRCVVCGAPIRTERDVGDDYLLPLGTLLDDGNIVVGEKLGRGGFGITYLALDTKEHGLIAVKEFVPSFMINSMRIGNSIYIEKDLVSQYQVHMRFFKREAHTLSKLNHPNIVRVYFEFEENNTCYYGMELLKGKNLYEWMSEHGTLPARDACQMLEPILDALIYLHSMEVLHRDISPGNIFLRDAPDKFLGVDPCLIDFGAAYDAQLAFSRSAPHIKSKGFSPPEQNVGHEIYGQYSDVYAIAAVFYYLTTGKLPVPSEDRTLRGARLPEPYTLDNSIPRGFSDAIIRAMHTDRTKRTQTVAAFREDLRRGLAKGGGGGIIRTGPGVVDTPQSHGSAHSRHSALEAGPPGDDLQPEPRTGPVWIRSFVGSLIDTVLFVACWYLTMSYEGARKLVNGNAAVGGLAVFAAALILNAIFCLRTGGTLGEWVVQATRRGMSGDKALVCALLQTIYPYALVDKLVACANGRPYDYVEPSRPGKVDPPGPSGGGTEHQDRPPCLEAGNPGDRRILIQRVELKPGGQTLGRRMGDTSRCDLPVSDSMCVSRLHCRIGFDDHWYVEDIGSKNGTFLNGNRLKQDVPTPLTDGSRISLGDEGIEFIFHAQG